MGAGAVSVGPRDGGGQGGEGGDDRPPLCFKVISLTNYHDDV